MKALINGIEVIGTVEEINELINIQEDRYTVARVHPKDVGKFEKLGYQTAEQIGIAEKIMEKRKRALKELKDNEVDHSFNNNQDSPEAYLRKPRENAPGYDKYGEPFPMQYTDDDGDTWVNGRRGWGKLGDYDG